MIGIDFTFVNSSEAENKCFTGSLSVFTADILDGIAKIDESENFTIITTWAAQKFISERFPSYNVVSIGGLPGRIIHFFFINQALTN